MTESTPPQTIGQVRQQLATCQVDLGRAVDQLKEVEEQLKGVSDQNAGFVASLREQIEVALTKLQPVVDEIASIADDESVMEHQEKFAKITGFFEEIQGLQSQFGPTS